MEKYLPWSQNGVFLQSSWSRYDNFNHIQIPILVIILFDISRFYSIYSRNLTYKKYMFFVVIPPSASTGEMTVQLVTLWHKNWVCWKQGNPSIHAVIMGFLNGVGPHFVSHIYQAVLMNNICLSWKTSLPMPYTSQVLHGWNLLSFPNTNVVIEHVGTWNTEASNMRYYPLVNSHSYGKSPFLLGKSTINVPFSSSQTVKSPEGNYMVYNRQLTNILWYISITFNYYGILLGYISNNWNIGIYTIKYHICYWIYQLCYWHQRHLYPIIIPSDNDSDDTWRTIGWKSQNAHLV